MSELKKLVGEDEKLFSDLPTKSSKIRFLNKKGFSRTEIAKKLEIRYQHVRNVLITPIKSERK